MRFGCDACGAQYMIADEKVGEKGVKVKCKKCGHVIVVRPAAASLDDGATGAEASQHAHFGDPGQGIAAQGGAGLGGMEAGVAASSQTDFGSSAAGVPQGEVAASAGAAQQNGDQMGGAFDSLFGDESQPGVGAGAQTPAPSSTPAGVKEWYVAIDDAQVGPIDVAEIEERWKAREIDEDSLAWKAGMSDWIPVADIPELAYLLTEHPQAKTAAHTSGGSSGVPASLAGATVGPASLGGGAEGGEVAWKPSAASALSSLVQEELVAAKEPEKPSESAAGSPPAGMDMPSFGGGDLFGSGGAAAASQQPMAPAFGSPGDAGWSVPAGPPKRRGGGNTGLIVALVVLGAIVVGGGAYFAATQLGQKPPEQQPMVAKAEKPDAEKSGDMKPEKTGGEGKETDADATKEAGQAAKDADKPKAPTPPTPPAAKTTKQTTTPKPPPKEPPRQKQKKDDIGSVFDDDKPKKESLTQADVVNTVREQAKTVGPCLQAARSSGEIVPGSYKFILNWTIRPNGTVQNPQLTGPASVMNSSLPGCFSNAMKKWKFPASKATTPVRNYPLGPITVR